jgi:hypothetical protein
MPKWTSLSREQAVQHPLYGFKGWIILYWVAAAAWVFIWSRSVVGNDRMILIMFETEQQVRLMRWVMTIDLLALLPFLILTPLKNPLAATVGLYGVIAHGLLRPFAAAFLVEIGGAKVPAIAGTHMGVAAAFVLYMLFSKRFNVTYRHRVKAA